MTCRSWTHEYAAASVASAARSAGTMGAAAGSDSSTGRDALARMAASSALPSANEIITWPTNHTHTQGSGRR